HLALRVGAGGAELARAREVALHAFDGFGSAVGSVRRTERGGEAREHIDVELVRGEALAPYGAHVRDGARRFPELLQKIAFFRVVGVAQRRDGAAHGRGFRLLRRGARTSGEGEGEAERAGACRSSLQRSGRYSDGRGGGPI